MGMYSSFQDEDLHLNEGKLKMDWEFGKLDKYKENETLQAFMKYREENGQFSFEAFDEWKIQGYWYDNFMEFLYLLKDYIDIEKDDYNYAEFVYEEGQPFKIVYQNEGEGEDGKPEVSVKVEYVPLNWEEFEIVRDKNGKITQG